MRTALITILALVLLGACKSKENIDELESGAARAASTDNLVAAYARRTRRAEAKLEDYVELAGGIESRLKVKRDEVRDLRAEAGRRAQEIQGLKKEVAALEAEIATLQKKKAELGTAAGSEKALVTGAEAELNKLAEERRDWVLRLEEARQRHEELAAAIVPLLAMLPDFSATAEVEEAPAEEPPAPTSQPAPADH